MNKLGIFTALAMFASSDFGRLDDINLTSNTSHVYNKSELTKTQRKNRNKNKSAKQSRRKNR